MLRRLPAKKKIKRPEQIVQIGIFKHLTGLMRLQNYSKFIAFHCPNGGWRSRAEAGIFKAMGTMAGITDIILLFNGGKTVFVELKLKTIVVAKRGEHKGKLVEKPTKQDDSQEWFEEKAKGLGFRYCLVEATDISDGLNQVLEIIEREGNG